MKTFKTLLFFFLVPAFVFANHAGSFSQPRNPQIKKEQAKRVLRRTAITIMLAHKKVKEGKVYTGNLARAIAHQKFARKLYREGKYFRAIHQSRRAKFLAVLAIKANKGIESADMNYSKEDESAMKKGPSDEELDKEVLKEMPNEPAKDEDVINAEPDVDLAGDE